MILPGKTQKLIIDHISKIGPYLVDPEEPEKTILLPRKEMPKGAKTGDELEVFVYFDSSDRIIATTRRPKIELGQIRPLTVAAVTRIGAFLDWGLEKDLLLPFHEQTAKVRVGREYLVKLYTDKSGRLCATMKIYNELESESPYDVGAWVEGYVYQINPEIGAFLAVDYKYHGMIPRKELTNEVHCGQVIKCRVSQIRKRDGRMTLSPRKQSYKSIGKDASVILRHLKEAGGTMPFNDKSDPRDIKNEFDMSKAAFKRGVGHLLRERKIELTESGMKLAAQSGKNEEIQRRGE